MVLIWDVSFFSFVGIKLVREVEEWVVISDCPEETDIIGDLDLIEELEKLIQLITDVDVLND